MYGASHPSCVLGNISSEIQQQLQIFTSAIDAVIYQLKQNKNGTLSMTYINDKVIDLCNVTPIDVKQDISCLVKCIHLEDIHDVKTSLKQSYASNKNWTSKFRININGKEKYIYVQSNIQKDDNGIAIWNGIALDITEQYHTTGYLYKNNLSLDKITTNTTDITMELDAKGRILTISPSVYDHLGYQKEDLYNQIYINLIHSDDKQQHLKNKKQCLKQPNQVITQQIRFLHKKGQEVIFDTSIQAVIAQPGSKTRLIGFFRNITNETLNQTLANELANFVESRQTQQTLSRIIDLLKKQLPLSIPTILEFNTNTNKLTHLTSTQNICPDFKKRLELGIEIDQNFAITSSKACIHIDAKSNHPNFTNMKNIMKACHIKTCSTYPIFSKNNELLGTLSFYFNESRSCTHNQDDIIGIFLPYISSILAHEKQDQLLSTINLHYRQSQQASQTGSWEWNLLNQSIWWSDETYRLLDVNKNTFSVSFESFLNLLTTESSNLAAQKAAEILKNGRAYSVILHLKSNPKKTILGQCYLIKDSAGNNLKLLGTIRDITTEQELKNQQIKLHTELKTREQLYLDILKNSPTLSIQILIKPTQKKEILYIDARIATLTQYALQDIKQDPDLLFSRIHPEDKDSYDQKLKNGIKSQQPFTQNFRLLLIDNTVEHVQLTTVTIASSKGIILNSSINIVTKQKEIENELDEKYELLELINNNAPGMVYQFKLAPNGAMSFPFVSAGAKDIYNLAPKTLMKSPLESINMHHPDDAKNFQGSIAKSAKSLTQWNYEGRIIVNDQEKWIKGRSNPKKQPDGSILWTGVLIDITKEKEMQFSKQKASDELMQLIDTANAPIFGIDTNGNVNEWNQKAAKITGYTKAEVIGKPFVETYITNDYKQAVQNVLTNALKGKETANYEVPIFTKNNTRIMVLLNATTRRNNKNNIIGVVGVGQDITEIDAVRSEKTNISDELTQLIDTANAPIFGIDINGNVNEWNQKSAEITGYAKTKVLGKPFVSTYITSDYKASVQTVLDNALQGKETANYEVPIFTKENKRRIILLNATTKRDKDGNIIGVVGVGQDITDKRIADEALTEAKLNQKVAEEKNRLKSDFLANMSHELRTPLNSIMGYTQLLTIKDTLTEKQLHYTTQIYQSSDHLLSLINGLLDLSKIESGKMSLNLSQIIIKEQVNQLLETLEPMLQTSKQCLKINLDHKISHITCDKIKLHQVLLNLLSNAIKFSPEQSTIILSSTLDSGHILFSIQDEGPGIPEELKSSIFDRYTQDKMTYQSSLDQHMDTPTVNNDTTSESRNTIKLGKGTGLGLALCKALVNLHGGQIWFPESTPSLRKGTCVCFTLPLTYSP